MREKERERERERGRVKGVVRKEKTGREKNEEKMFNLLN